MPLLRGLVTESQTATAEGSRVKVVHCEQCGAKFSYMLKRTGFGGAEAYRLSCTARGKAEVEAQKALKESLEKGSELVPCPTCGWYQKSMIDRYHKDNFQAFGALSVIILGFAFLCLLFWAGLHQKGQVSALAPWHWLFYLFLVAAAFMVGVVIWRFIYNPNRIRFRLSRPPPSKLITPGRIQNATLSKKGGASATKPSPALGTPLTSAESSASASEAVPDFLNFQAQAQPKGAPSAAKSAPPSPARKPSPAAPASGSAAVTKPAASRPPSAKPAPASAAPLPTRRAVPSAAAKFAATCTKCHAKFLFAADMAGRKVRCKRCSTVFVANQPSTAVSDDEALPLADD